MMGATAAAAQTAQHWSGLPWVGHFSTELSPVRVTLRNRNDPEPDHRATVTVPKAYIVYFDGVSHTPRLSSSLETSEIELDLTYPDGKPLTVHAGEIAKTSGGSLEIAGRSLRSQHISVTLSYVRPDIPWELRLRQRNQSTIDAEPFEGLAHVIKNGRDYYFGDERSDQFIQVLCFPYANAMAQYFCSTYMRVGGDVIATVKFVDFRFNGGRAFLNERIRFVRATVCRFLENAC